MAVIEVRLFEVYGLFLLLRAFVRVERYFWMQAQDDSDEENDCG
jgi:hypothetical protein